MSYDKFIVEDFERTRSGHYACFTRNGSRYLTSNFDFKIGDVVEWWGYDGYCPSRIVVNGVETWNEENQKQWWIEYNRQGEELAQRIRNKEFPFQK
jgi:hypothetical protein